MLDNLAAARAQMAISLGFHMVFAALGIGLPLLMLLAEGLWLRTQRPVYMDLARKWAKATGILFAIGAVSGTALSFELGLLWPRFMGFAGGIIGPMFALEGYAFFIEAIFLGLYLYGWQRLSPRAHWLVGVPVALSGVFSGIIVVAANAWMQTPAGFGVVDGAPVNIEPVAAMFNQAWGVMALHSTLASYMTAGFLTAAVYAWGLLRGRGDAYHRAGLALGLLVGTIAAVLQPISGDMAARLVAVTQPVKLAALESQFQTERNAPLRIGGIPDTQNQQVYLALEIPSGLSLLAFHDPNALIVGLDSVPQQDWPVVPVVHIGFQLMVGSGIALLLFGLWYWFLRWRKKEPGTWLLRFTVLGGVLGVVALEAGWIVTEVGRQPWIIYRVMRTADAVSPVPGLWVTLVSFTVLYLVLTATLVWLLRRIATGRPLADAALGGPKEAADAPA